jgi:predicted Zn finger-like uncharacterized protein
MKIVCDACQAKYSISDDKVQGKVFKIRCKKCSNIIVVRGGASAAEPAPAPEQQKDTRVYDYGYEGGQGAPAADDQVWHVVINQDQVGPMTAAEVQERFARSEIDAETYVWREGFADWLPLAQVDQFAALATSGSTTAALGGGGGGHAAVAAMFGGGTDESGTVRSDPGDLFAAASASSKHADDDSGDLFGRKPAAAAPASSAAANAKLRGERNENSVLFSLNNLAQLASDKPAPAPAASASPGAATGAAGGEGSGLIDIRSMASAYMGSSGTTAKPATASAIGSIDDLPVFGGGGFSEPAVIVPTARPANNNKLMYALIGTVGVLAVVAVIMVVVLLKGDKDKNENKAGELASTTGDKKTTDDKKTDDTAKPDKTTDNAAATTDTKGSGDQVKTDQAKAPDAKAPDAKTPDPKTDPKTVKKDTPPPAVKKDTSTHSATPVTQAVKKDTTPKAPPPEPKTTKKDDTASKDSGGSCDEVSCVLNNYEGACCAKFKKGGSTGPKPPTGGPTPTAAPHSDLPEGLDKGMISDGVSRVKARVMACGDKSSAKGQVKVSVKVAPDGHVAGVTVKNTPDPALGNCVAGAMNGAHFSKTQNGGSFGYPFVF